MDQHNIKVMLTEHGYYDWNGHQKVRFLFQGIKTKDIDYCITQIHTAGLCDDFAGANLHVANYLLVCKAHDCDNNRQVSGIDTHGGGKGDHHWRGHGGVQNGGGSRRGGVNGGRGLPTQPDINTCTSITKTYYTDSKYRNSTAKEKQKVWKKHKRAKNGGSDTMSSIEMSRNIYNIATHAGKQENCVCYLERTTYDGAPTFSEDDEETRILEDYNRKARPLESSHRAPRGPRH